MAALRVAGLPASSLGFYARPVDSAQPLAAFNEEQVFVLASTSKVVTSLAALDLLGQDFHWRTHAYARGALVDGRLAGDLLIVGGGDARLSSEELLHWFAQMRERGLRQIDGNIVLDRFAFRITDADHLHTPEPGQHRPHHVWPDALPLDEGVLRISLAPTRGDRAELTLTPALQGLTLNNEVRMRAGGRCAAWASMAEVQGQPRLLVRGSWSRACGRRQIQVVPMSHGEFTTRAVAGLWRQAGGLLHGNVVDRPSTSTGSSGIQRDARGALEQPWSVHRSDSLPRLVHDINKNSNNLGSRNLWLSLSPGFPLQAATLAGAQARVLRWLQAQGLADGDIQVDSGSGLSRTERGKPRAMVQLLCNAWGARLAEAFVASLPIAGVDGTLAHRMTRGAATGQAFLKTGSLLDARALAGYVKARSGNVYAVAAMVNHPRAVRATRALDALIEWIVRNG